MNYSEVKEFCSSHLTQFGDVKARPMFGCYGVFINGDVVLQFTPTACFVRANPRSKQRLLAKSGNRLIYKKLDRDVCSKFYEYPMTELHSDEFLRFVEDAIAAKECERELYNNGLIRNQVNLTQASERRLKSVGICNIAQLTRVGAAAAYRKLEPSSSSLNKKLLFSLEGAITKRHWSIIPDARKQELMSSVFV